MNEELIMNSIKSGSERDFKVVFDEYWASINYSCFSILKDNILSEDVALDCFCKLWDNRHKMQNVKHVNNFLYFTAKNACISLMRKQKIDKRTEKGYHKLTGEVWADSIEEEREYSRNIELVFKSIPLLEKNSKVALVDKFRGIKPDKTKDKLSTTRGNVYLLQCRAIQFIKSLVKPCV